MNPMRGLAVSILLFGAFAKTGSAQMATPSALAAGEATIASADFWGAGQNPANAREDKGFAVQAYGFTHLHPAELSRFGLDLGYRLEKSFFTLSTQHFFPPGYSVSSYHLSVARPLAENFDIGLRVGLLNANFEEYGRELLPTAQGGIRYKISPALSAGAYYRYAERQAEPLASHDLSLGIDYRSSERLHVLLMARQAVGERFAGGLGLRFEAHERLNFQLGMRSGGNMLSFGVQTKITEELSLSVAAHVFQELPAGFSYGLEW